MTVRLGPDHPCAFCGTPVYHRIDDGPGVWGQGSIPKYTSSHAYEVDTYRMHVCPMTDFPPAARAERVRCEACGLHVYSLLGDLFDDDAATGAHACEMEPVEPNPVAQPPAHAPVATAQRSAPKPVSAVAPIEAQSILGAN